MNKTAFIFDDVCIAPSQQIGKHSHSLWELTYIIIGEGVHTIGDTTAPFRQGEIMLIPPDTTHLWQFDTSRTDSHGHIANISVFFDTDTLTALSNVIPEYGSIIEEFRSLSEAVCYAGETHDRISSLLLSMRGLSATMRIPKMFELIAAISDTTNCRKAGSNNIKERTERRLDSVRIYCDCNYARDISLDEIAAYAGMNKSAFCSFMRRHTGMNFSKFINSIRLERAYEMLSRTDNNISTIAYDVGFSNVTYFNRLFRSRFGCTPKSVKNRSVIQDAVSSEGGHQRRF